MLAIISYIADDNPDAAQELKDEIEAKAAGLIKHPKTYPTGRVDGVREMFFQSNYILVYVEDAAAITVLRILHAAQQ